MLGKAVSNASRHNIAATYDVRKQHNKTVHMTGDLTDMLANGVRQRKPRAPSQPPTSGAPFQDGGKTIADKAYDELHRDIVSMTLPPGTPISEQQVAAQKGVSRTPVREAILRLTRERLVEVVPKSGTFVARIPLSSLTEALIVRRALEGTIVRAAASAPTPSQILELRTIIEHQREVYAKGDTDTFHGTDEAFHAAIARICGYQGIWELIRQVKVQVDRYRRLTLPQQGRIALIIDEHADIVQAIEDGNPDTAVARMEYHLDKLQLDIAVFRDLYPDYFIHDKSVC